LQQQSLLSTLIRYVPSDYRPSKAPKLASGLGFKKSLSAIIIDCVRQALQDKYLLNLLTWYSILADRPVLSPHPLPVKSLSFRMHASASDALLLDALRADDEAAFAEIYKRYSFRLFTVAYRKVKSREAAEELVQDLFENLWSRRACSQIQQLESYLFSAIRYRVINYIKSQKLQEGYQLYLRLSGPEQDLDTEESLALNDLSAALLAGVRNLPEKSQEVFRLSRLEYYSVQEISEQVNLSEKTVEYHLTKSLKLLRQYLRDFLLMTLPFLLLLR
jgi:RNA polymerase sigma-70 factor (family 1)